MAIYHLGVKSFGRSAGLRGSVSTNAAAYRAGERIRDERTGAVYDHSRRRDVLHKEILLPSKYAQAGAQLDWARDRSQLWNAAERAESRRDSRVAREYVLALPHELDAPRRIALARAFALEIADRYNNAVDLAIHQPRTDPRNFHAHLLTTTREITPAGLGAKTNVEWSGTARHRHGLSRAAEEHMAIKERWAQLANGALREAGLTVRISHLADRDAILRPGARPWLPRIAWEIERRGGHSVLGEHARQRFEARQRARQLQRATEPQQAQAAERQQAQAPERQQAQTAPERDSRSAEELAQQSARNWWAVRERILRGEAVDFGESKATRESELSAEKRARALARDDYGL